MIIHNPILTGSFTVNGTDIASITSSAASITAINSYTASQNILNGTYTLTSSFAAQTASFTAFTSSVNSFTASQLVLNGTYATTSSNTFAGIQTINSNLIVTGSITAQTLVVQTVTSSVVYSSGSNVFGNNIANTQVFTGSMLVTGSATFANNVTSNNMFINTTDNSSGAKFQISGSINFKSNSGYNGWVISQAGGSSAAAFNLSYGAGGASNVITAQYDNGFVGIGTPSPQAKFELSGSSGNFQIASSGAEVFFTRNDNNDFLANGGSSAGIRMGAQQQLRFATGTGLSTRMTIDVSGNVLLNNVAAQFQWEGGNYWTWRTVTSGTEFWLYRGDTGASPLIMTTGNVLRLSSLAGAGSRTVTADASGNLSASSDSSLKQEDTTHTIEGLAEILQLKPRAYKWLSDIEIRGEEATTEIGFFANEVNSIIPSAAPKGNDDLYGFYDRAVIAALVKAIQELQAQITELKNK